MNTRPIVARIRSGDGDEGDPLREALKEALSHWPGGVAVLVVREDDEVVALTINAFTAVSVDPPLVLVCVAEHAAILPSLLDAGRFTVNFLPESARAVAVGYAQNFPPGPPPFDDEGDPVMRGVLASLVCSTWALHPGGDHRIVVGRVERVVLGEEAPPLVYHRRNYRGLR